MNCEDVKKKIPEYLAGVLESNISKEMKSHIDQCNLCKKEADELMMDLPPYETIEDGNLSKVIKKTKRKFKFSIVRVTLVVFLVAWIIYSLPVLLWNVMSFNQPNASRVLMDIVQFSQPYKVNSWGNRGVDRSKMSVPLTVTALSQVGKNYGGQMEYEGYFSVITGKVSVPPFYGANFLHPELFKDKNLGANVNPQSQRRILQKNENTTVATVDFSLNKVIGLKEITDLVKNFDVDICWMAVESGIESITFKNMKFEKQQVLQWGIPGILSNPGNLEYIDINKTDINLFENEVLKEMKWLSENIGLVKPDGDLKNIESTNNSSINISNTKDMPYKNAIKYILNSGIKIYGLRVTGPSSELLRLSEELDLRKMNVVDMDFWNWE